MKTIGITGSFASGKSFVLKYIAGLGYKIFSADEFVNGLYQNQEIQRQICDILPQLKSFDKSLLSSIIYSDDTARIALQNLIHPLVLKAIEDFKLRNKSSTLIFAEVPLLFEVGFEQYFDFVITTFCMEKSRLERAKMRKNFDQNIYDKITQVQFSQEEKIKKANIAINTDASLLELETQINQLIIFLTGQ